MHAKGIAADGKPVTVGSIAAPRSVKFGTRVRVGDLGVFVVRDVCGYPGRWDIFFPRHEDAKKFGNRTLDITILP
jgi:3D (Asp-Asp-Asp) domain-containing protein